MNINNSNEKNRDDIWDVFISHASEDKKDFVRPLAESLRKYGVRVWYDEFELKAGDSLSDSIDRGLKKSKYGIVVCSPAFFDKNWTDYELKSLLMRQIHSERVILPIWHNVTKDYIQEQSLYLLDIKALSSEMEWSELIEGILKIVRPDILNSHLMLKKGAELYKQAKNSELQAVEIPLNQLYDSPVRHKSLPVHLVIATRLISEVFWDVLPMKYEEMVVDFSRDLDYDHEFVIWSAMANAYVAFIRETQCAQDNLDKKRELITLLLGYSGGREVLERNNLQYVNEREYYYLIQLFLDNYDHLIDMMKKYK